MSSSALCLLCGKYIKEPRIVDEVAEGKRYVFDSDDCALIFRKFKSVYGKDNFILE